MPELELEWNTEAASSAGSDGDRTRQKKGPNVDNTERLHQCHMVQAVLSVSSFVLENGALASLVTY